MNSNAKTRIDLFIATLLTFSFIAVVGYFLVFAKSEGAFKENAVMSLLVDAIVYLFPLIFLSTKGSLDWITMLAFTNIIIYSILAVVLFTDRLRSYHQYRPYKLIHIIAYVIPIIFMAIFIAIQF